MAENKSALKKKLLNIKIKLNLSELQKSNNTEHLAMVINILYLITVQACYADSIPRHKLGCLGPNIRAILAKIMSKKVN